MPHKMSAHLVVDGLTVRFKEKTAVDNVSFQLAEGHIGCLLGPSGCGKTTILRAIAGFQALAAGKILLHGERVSDAHCVLAVEKRRVGMLFQDFALFPHLSVADNVGFGLLEEHGARKRARIDELLELVELSDCSRVFPHQLSGGQQQRVALARALAPNPKILLLDEPFSNIDVDLREQLVRDVGTILRQQRITTLLVTHDQLEAFAIADEIGVLNDGHLHQWDTGFNLYHQPADLFVADFIGQGVLLDGEILPNNQVRTELGDISGKRLNSGLNPGDRVHVLVRPDDVLHDDSSAMKATVIEKSFRGAEFMYRLRLETGGEVLCFAPSHHNHAVNEQIGICLELDHLIVFKKTDY